MSDGDSILQDQGLQDPGHDYISSARVEGTPVFGRDGKRIGNVHSVIIHKVTGQVAYAVLAFGGFLHRGEYVHSVPWSQLTYDVARHGYVVELTRDQIDAAPRIKLADIDRLTNRPPPFAFI